jgi:hypothetical protein
MRWWPVLTLSILFAVVAFVAAGLSAYSSIRVVSDEIGELRIILFGMSFHQERGPWQLLEQKGAIYGWALIGGLTAIGMLLGAGIGVIVGRRLN